MPASSLRLAVRAVDDNSLVELWQEINFWERTGSIQQYKNAETGQPIPSMLHRLYATLGVAEAPGLVVLTVLAHEVWREVALRKCLPEWLVQNELMGLT